MKIEAVITCVDYADFLAETLPHNRTLFDKLVVVTAPEDKATQRICEYWHVACLPTDSFRSRWGEFNKGAAINEGLAQLDKTEPARGPCHLVANHHCRGHLKACIGYKIAQRRIGSAMG